MIVNGRECGRNWRAASVGALMLAGMLAGCAGSGGGGNGDPGARPLPPGASCQSIQSEMNRLIDHGVQGAVEAQSAGQKLSPQRKADADRYNQLLEQYLGARCQVPAAH